MTENSCIEQDALVDYLYGEADDDTRRRIETHARGCAQCADEIGGLREVRDILETWNPPPAAIGFRVVSPDGEEPQDRALAPAPRFGWGRLRRVPGWGLAAAAVLVLATGAVVAKPEVQFNQGGMVVRIGWTDTMSSPAPLGVDSVSEPELVATSDEPRPDSQPVRGTPVGTGGRPSGREPRRAESALGVAGAAGDEGVRQMVRESEQRQQRALVNGLEQLEQQQINRRRADLVDLEQTLARMGSADGELNRQQLLESVRALLSR
ncbi:MAG: zf-HC2 domain-containing protein [Vicinamibacterales bacterium]|nr:zf-HC2 domain-containing protein [Vicinamibacterales bacterium]